MVTVEERLVGKPTSRLSSKVFTPLVKQVSFARNYVFQHFWLSLNQHFFSLGANTNAELRTQPRGLSKTGSEDLNTFG